MKPEEVNIKDIEATPEGIEGWASKGKTEVYGERQIKCTVNVFNLMAHNILSTPNSTPTSITALAHAQYNS